MIVYQNTNGRAHDVRFVPDSYVAQPGETLIEGDTLPALESLHDAPTLAELKAAKWELIKAARDAQRDAGFLYNAKLFQSDAVSRDNIAGAAQAASFAQAAGQPYAVDWTCADNTVVALDAGGVIGLFLAGAQHVQVLYAKGVQLRQKIEAAQSAEELEAIGW